METFQADSIVWSGQEFLLKDFVESFKLPQIIKVEEGYHDPFEEDRTLSSSQLLTLHSVKELTTVKATTENSLEVLLPTDSQSKVTVIRESNGPDYYDVVEELANAFPTYASAESDLPCFNISANEAFELKKKTKKQRTYYLICNVVNKNKTVELPFDFKARFKVLGNCPISSPTLDDVLKHCKLPCEVKFVDDKLKLFRDGYSTDRPFAGFNTMGTVRLNSLNHYKVVFTTTWEDRKASAVLPLPLDLEIRVVAALGAIQNNKNYSKLCKIAQDKTKSEQLVLKFIRHGPCKVLLDDKNIPNENVTSEYDEVGPKLPPRSLKPGGTRSKPLQPPKLRPTSVPSVPDRKALPSPTKDIKENVLDKESYISVKERGRTRSVNFPTNWNAEELDNTSANSSKSASKSHNMFTDSKKTLGKIFSPLKKVRSKVGKEVKKRVLQRSSSLQQNVDSNSPTSASSDGVAEYREVTPVPGKSADRVNQEFLPKINIKTDNNPRDRCNIRNPDDIQSWSVDEVAEVLRFCHLDMYIENFRKEKIDGSLLACLDGEAVTSLRIKDPLHHKKMMKIIGGWLPKT